MPHLSRIVSLALCDDQLLPFLYTYRWTICVVGTRLLQKFVQLSVVTMVLGLIKLAFALLPLPLSLSTLDHSLIYALGGIAILLVLHELWSFLNKNLKPTTGTGAAADLLSQQDSFIEATINTGELTIDIVESDSLQGMQDDVINDDSSDEEDITLCDSMIPLVKKSPRQIERIQPIVISSSDEEDEISEVSIDIRSLLEEEATAIRLRLEVEKMDAESRRLEGLALQAFDIGSVGLGRQILQKRDELVQESRHRRKKASGHTFRYHNPTYSDSKAGLTRLDLHGLNTEEAKSRIYAHLEMCRKRRIKLTRIITGKGLHSMGGKPVLKPLTLYILQLQPDLTFMLQPGNTGVVVVTFKHKPNDLQA